MDKKDNFTKVLAIIGTVLVWLPLLAPLLLWLVSPLLIGRFLLDYLMPMELAFLVLGGGLLLGWAALRAHDHFALVAWSLGIAVVMLVGSQSFAEVSGLASGETAVGGWQYFLVMAMLVVYILAVFSLGLAGAILLHDLFGGKISEAGAGR